MGAADGFAPAGERVRVHRVHVSLLQEGVVTLSGSEARHLTHVLRVAPGQKVRAFDGKGLEAEGEVQTADALRVTVKLSAPIKSDTEARLAVTLAIALLKGDKLSDVVRQGTELGAVRFVLVTSRHGDVPSLSSNKLERLRRVAKEAAKQSGRSVVPTIEPPAPLLEVPLNSPVLVAHPQASLTLKDAADIGLSGTASSLTVVTGPEGGLSEDEISRSCKSGARWPCGWARASCGPRPRRSRF